MRRVSAERRDWMESRIESPWTDGINNSGTSAVNNIGFCPCFSYSRKEAEKREVVAPPYIAANIRG
jgi:hypothetical protein